MTWNNQKLAYAGVTSTVILLFQGLGLLMISAFGLGSATPLMAFIAPLFLLLGYRIIDENGAYSLIALLYSVMAVPIPAAGPPGFLPKIPDLVISALIAELVLYLMDSRRYLSSALSGGIFSTLVVLIGVQLFLLFDVPGASKILEAGLPLYALTFVEGAAGGLVGERLFSKLETRKVLQRFNP
jgi:hypothetical protein